MALLDIVNFPDEVLLSVGKPLEKEDFGSGLDTLVKDMFETMYESGGVGLAAPQVGKSIRLFVMDCSGGADPESQHAIINPEVVSVVGEQYGDEGCLSFPGIYTKVKREMSAVVRFQRPDGSIDEREFTELEARCFLHETDHCD